MSLDGSTGEVFLGRARHVRPRHHRRLAGQRLLSWADDCRRLGVRANADYPARRDAGAAQTAPKGIGLCRTEHMFFEHRAAAGDAAMIMSDSITERRDALEELRAAATGGLPGSVPRRWTGYR